MEQIVRRVEQLHIQEQQQLQQKRIQHRGLEQVERYEPELVMKLGQRPDPPAQTSRVTR